MIKWITKLFKKSSNDPWRQAYKNSLYRANKNITFHREKYDDLLDCSGKTIVDIDMYTWNDRIIIHFTDGTFLNIDLQKHPITNFKWTLGGVKS